MAVHRHVRLPLWDRRLGAETLRARQASMGAREFDRSFRQRAIGDLELLFKASHIEACLDPRHAAVDAVPAGSLWATLPRYAGVDLAISTTNVEAAFFVILSIAVDPAGHRWILHLFRERNLSFGQQVRLLTEFHERFQYSLLVVESNGYQQAIIDHVGGTTQLPIQGLQTGALQKRDVEIGIPSLAVEWEHKRWHVPQQDARSHRLMEPLLEELAGYDQAPYDDTVLAAYFAREAARPPRRPRADIQILRV